MYMQPRAQAQISSGHSGHLVMMPTPLARRPGCAARWQAARKELAQTRLTLIARLARSVLFATVLNSAFISSISLGVMAASVLLSAISYPSSAALRFTARTISPC